MDRPPCSNRGVTDPATTKPKSYQLTVTTVKTSKHIDWLSITISPDLEWRNFIPFADLKCEGKGRHGYSQAWVDKHTGARIETGANRKDMGTHITLTGDTLQAMRDDLGAVDDKIAERIIQWDGRCSRIDLAIDCFGASFTPNELNAAMLERSAHLRARTWRFIDGHSNGVNGATLDTGSPKSDVRFRFYDKRAEKRIKDGEAWVRLELQLRRLYARSTIGACVEHGVSAMASNLIGSYLRWSDEEYQAAIASDGTYSMTIPRGETKRRTWLLGQVAKALASELYDDPTFRKQFVRAVMAQLTHIKAELDR